MDHDTEYNDMGATVRVRVRIPGLEPVGGSCFGGNTDEEPKANNANFDGPYFTEHGYRVIVRMDGRTIPIEEQDIQHAIVPAGCYCNVEKNFLHLYLKKKIPNQSWTSTIRQGHL